MAQKPEDALIGIGFIALILLMILSKVGLITIDGAKLTEPTTQSRSAISGGSGITKADREAEKEAEKAGRSKWAGKITLTRGNASYEFQPNKEYITLNANGLRDEKVTITGWTLTNGKGSVPYQRYDGRVYFPSDIVKIPGAARLFVLDGVNTNSPIVLERGSKVTLVTGTLSNINNTYLGVNGFLVNQCSGYIENLPSFDFQPRLSNRSCPKPEDEVNIRGLEKSCRVFVENLQTCKTPQFDTRTFVNGELQRDCVDGVCGLTSQCRVMLRNTFNYNACVSRHASDQNFYTKEWRVYLNQKWELWAKEYETITLFDEEGKVVDSVSW